MYVWWSRNERPCRLGQGASRDDDEQLLRPQPPIPVRGEHGEPSGECDRVHGGADQRVAEVFWERGDAVRGLGQGFRERDNGGTDEECDSKHQTEERVGDDTTTAYTCGHLHMATWGLSVSLRFLDSAWK